jgi:hypothetical protein
VCIELKFGFREKRHFVCGAQILILLEKRQCGNQVRIHQGFVPDFNPTSFGHVDEVKMSKSFSSSSPTSCEQMFVDGERKRTKDINYLTRPSQKHKCFLTYINHISLHRLWVPDLVM